MVGWLILTNKFKPIKVLPCSWPIYRCTSDTNVSPDFLQQISNRQHIQHKRRWFTLRTSVEVCSFQLDYSTHCCCALIRQHVASGTCLSGESFTSFFSAKLALERVSSCILTIDPLAANSITSTREFYFYFNAWYNQLDFISHAFPVLSEFFQSSRSIVSMFAT